MSNTDIQHAKQTLSHYLRLAVETSGGQWRGDNQAEAEYIVEDILDAVRGEMNANLSKLEQRINALEGLANE